MHIVHIAVVLGCLSSTLAGYSQFFYRTAPYQQQFFRQDYPVHQPIYQPNPVHQPFYNPNPVYQPVYNPIPRYFAPPQVFAYQHAHAIPKAPEQVQDISEVQGRTDATPSPPQDAKFNYERKESGSFRGFAYHTELDHGAQSNVIFITGPEAHKYQLPSVEENANTHTKASDAVDSNAPKEDAESIEVNSPIRALVRFLENPQVGVQKFYSIDNTLVARRQEDDYLGYPASTLPLQAPVSPLYSLLRSSFNPSVDTKVVEPQGEPAGAASETKTETVEPNEVIAKAASTTTTMTTAASTAVTTTAASTMVTTTTAASTAATTSEVTTKSTMEPIIVEDGTDEDNNDKSSR